MKPLSSEGLTHRPGFWIKAPFETNARRLEGSKDNHPSLAGAKVRVTISAALYQQ